MALGALIRKIFSPGNARPKSVLKAHPDEIALQDEVLKSLSLGARRTVRYPPFMEGFPAYLTSEYLLGLQEDLYTKMLGGVGLPFDQFNELVRPVILNYSRFVHLLPASENHHHCGPGGLLRHGMEVAFFTMNATKNSAFDSRRPPSERSRRAIRWNVAGLLCGLLHDTGKAVTDMHVVFPPEGLRWIHSENTIEEWAQEHNLSKYYIEWQKGRHNRHIQKSYALVMKLCPPTTLTWLIEGGEDILDALMDAIVGNEDSALYRPLMTADGRSTQLDMASGEAPQFMTGVPVMKLVTSAMTRLVQDGTWLCNQPGARVWSTTQGVFIAWNNGAQEIINLILEDKVEAIPRTPNALLMRLIDQSVAERNPEGEMYWEVAPDCIQKSDKPLILRCMKLASADTLFPYDPVPPPVGVRLKITGELVPFPAVNDALAELTQSEDGTAGAESAEQAPIPAGEVAEVAPEQHPEARGAEAIYAQESAAAHEQKSGGTSRPLQAEKADNSEPADPMLNRIADIDFAGGDEQSFQDGIQQALMVLGGGSLPAEDEGDPQPAAEENPETETTHQQDANAAPAENGQGSSEKPQKKKRPSKTEASSSTEQPQNTENNSLRPSTISLSREKPVRLGLGSGKSKKQQPSNKPAPAPIKLQPDDTGQVSRDSKGSAAASTPKPNSTSRAAIKPATTAPVAAPGQQELSLPSWDITAQEKKMLAMHPELAQAVLDTLNQQDMYGVYLRRLFIPLKSETTVGIDESLVPKLEAAGWLWEDFTGAAEGAIFSWKRLPGIIPASWLDTLLARNISRELTGLLSTEVTEEQIEGLEVLADALLEQCRPETLKNGVEVLMITQHMMKQIAATFDSTPDDAYAALHTHRNAVPDWRRKAVYILPLAGELKRLSS